MRTIEARFRIVTPMFIGDAEQKATAIRPPSIKGALRFWWRALNWARFRRDAKDDATALQALHREEARLFGAAATGEGGGQGCFILRVMHRPMKRSEENSVHPAFKIRDAARYLAYGLMEAFSSRKKNTEAGQLTRSCINEGQEFTVRLTFRGEIDPSVQQALVALGLLGSLGRRARHGLGSVALQDIKQGDAVVWSAPESRETYERAVQGLFVPEQRKESLLPFTAFSAHSRVDVLIDGNKNALDVVNDYGEKLLMYRSWGRGGKVLGKDSEANFKRDHDWSKGDRPTGFHPMRVVFGLPHNYGRETNMQVKAEKHERRASPLLFHVHAVGNSFLGVSILLPAAFLPQGERINAGGLNVNTNVDWSVLTDFLDGAQKSDKKPRFPARKSLTGGKL